MTTETVPRHLAIMRGWLGEKEVPGPKANPVIIDWFKTVDYAEITSDEVANCAAAVGASLVKADAGYPLPARETRLLARSYATYGADARHDPQPGDIVVVPRGAAWQGHVMLLDQVQSSLRRYKCIGANQSDTTSVAYVGFDAEIVAIRRPVAATAKDLLAAGSKGVARGVTLKRVGDGLTVGTPVTAGIAKAAEKGLGEVPAHVPDPAALPALDPSVPIPFDAPLLPDVTTIDGMKTATEHMGIVQTFTEALVSFGMVFVKHPWLLAPIVAGILIRMYGVETIVARVRSHLAGVPLSSARETP